jgi:ABC-type lipoprotein export system ATPase subunit
VLKLLRDLAGAGQAVLRATHSDDAAAICDRVIHLRDGRVV